MGSIIRRLSAPERNARKLVCKHGHPLTGDNVRVEWVGPNKDRKQRVCKTCHRQRKAARDKLAKADVSPLKTEAAIVLCVWDNDADQYVPASSHRGVSILAKQS